MSTCRNPATREKNAEFVVKGATTIGIAQRGRKARTTSRSSAPDPGRKSSQITYAANVGRKAIGLQSVGSGAGQRSNPAAGAFHKVNILAGTTGPILRGGPGTEMTVRGPETDGMGPGMGVLDLMDPNGGLKNPTATGPSQGHPATVTNTNSQVKRSRGLARYQSHSPAVAGAPGSHAPRQRPPNGVVTSPQCGLSRCVRCFPSTMSISRPWDWTRLILRSSGIL